jgi:hypothetical protein
MNGGLTFRKHGVRDRASNALPQGATGARFRLDFRITLASDNPELIVKECFNQHVRCFVGQGNQSEIELTVFQPQQQIVRQILTQCQ